MRPGDKYIWYFNGSRDYKVVTYEHINENNHYIFIYEETGFIDLTRDQLKDDRLYKYTKAYELLYV